MEKITYTEYTKQLKAADGTTKPRPDVLRLDLATVPESKRPLYKQIQNEEIARRAARGIRPI